MPFYEYYCPDCKTKFDALRPMAESDAQIACKQCNSLRPTRMISMFATTSSSSGGEMQMPGGGGCCGGSCGCGH